MLLLQSVLPNQERSARRAGSFVLDKIDLEQMKHKWLCMAFIAKIVLSNQRGHDWNHRRPCGRDFSSHRLGCGGCRYCGSEMAWRTSRV